MVVLITPYRELGDAVRARRLLGVTLASIDAQATEVLHIIVDDGNTDECCEYLRSLSGPARRVLRRTKPPNEVLGCSPAQNLAFDWLLDGGDGLPIPDDAMVSTLHADDLALALDQRVAACGTTAAFCYSDAALLIEGSTDIMLWPSLRLALSLTRTLSWMLGRLAYPTMTWRLDFLHLLRDYNASTYGHRTIMDNRIGCAEDVDLGLSSIECAIRHRVQVARPNVVTAAYRIRKDSLSEVRDQHERQREERFVLEKHFGRRAWLLRVGRAVVRPETVSPRLMALKLPLRRRVDAQCAKTIRGLDEVMRDHA